WEPSSRYDRLNVDPDANCTIRVRRFLPSKVNCERGVLSKYKLRLTNQATQPTTDNAHPLPQSIANHVDVTGTTADQPCAVSREAADGPASYYASLVTDAMTSLVYNAYTAVQHLFSYLTTRLRKTSPELSKPARCNLCLTDDVTIRRSAIFPCGHVACCSCIDRWLSERNSCPFCRCTVER
ncbi:hypothetical protein PFISCL1PPCAC_13339, partial [Pristionchus fissidentatus]